MDLTASLSSKILMTISSDNTALISSSSPLREFATVMRRAMGPVKVGTPLCSYE